MTFTIHLPQLLYLIMVLIALADDAINHGKPKKGTENIYTTLVATALVIGLLYWGGFFRG